MHDYAVFGHDRSSIGRWLGLLAILIAGGISQLTAKLANMTNWEAFSKATITTGVIYFILHWLFNKWVWRLPFFEIPNLNGVWEVSGKTLGDNGDVKYEWPAILDIEQNWKQISINIKTSKSQSQSYTATLLKKHGIRGGWVLSYSYKNEPNLDKSHELNSHKGFCEIEFDKEFTIAKGTYFNSNGRRTYGLMDIVKESK